MKYRIEWPVPLDELDWMTQEAKGWIMVTVVWDGGQRIVTFYDPVRLMQSVTIELDTRGIFAEGSLVVVPRVTLDAVETAIARFAERDFADI
jgi:hypothetical protein